MICKVQSFKKFHIGVVFNCALMVQTYDALLLIFDSTSQGNRFTYYLNYMYIVAFRCFLEQCNLIIIMCFRCLQNKLNIFRVRSYQSLPHVFYCSTVYSTRQICRINVTRGLTVNLWSFSIYTCFRFSSCHMNLNN